MAISLALSLSLSVRSRLHTMDCSTKSINEIQDEREVLVTLERDTIRTTAMCEASLRRC